MIQLPPDRPGSVFPFPALSTEEGAIFPASYVGCSLVLGELESHLNAYLR